MNGTMFSDLMGARPGALEGVRKSASDTDDAIALVRKAVDAGTIVPGQQEADALRMASTHGIEQRLNQMATERQRVDHTSFAKAYSAAIQTPEGKALYSRFLQARGA